MGEIKYTYKKLEESASTISCEKTQLESHDKLFLTGLRTDMESFHSDYADRIVDIVGNMEDTGAQSLITQLERYSDVLDKAGSKMKELEEQIASDYSKEGE